MNILIKKLKTNAISPFQATEDSAGADLFACIDEDITIKAGEILSVPTGIALEPEKNDVALLIYPRSGLSSKFGVSLANCVGVVDSDYRGEIIVPLINHSDKDFIIEKNMRIAQLVVTPIIRPKFIESNELSSTKRGCNGFGSTGK